MAFLQGPPINVEWLERRNWWGDVDTSGGPDACWPWVKSTASHGYGQTWDGTTVRLAHRVAYTLCLAPIPEGMTVDHVCRNKRCCNPEHLRLLSNADNASLNSNARKTHCPLGHPYDEANTYRGTKGRQCIACWPRWKHKAA
jgi:hypothetical protein